MGQSLTTFLEYNGLGIDDIDKNCNTIVCGDILVLRVKQKDIYNSEIFYILGILCGKTKNEYYTCYEILTNIGMIKHYIRRIQYDNLYNFISISILGKIYKKENKSIENLCLFCNKCLSNKLISLSVGIFYQYYEEYKLYLGDVIINDKSYTNISINLQLNKINIKQVDDLNNLNDMYKYINYNNIFMYEYPNIDEVYVLNKFNLVNKFYEFFVYSDSNKYIILPKKMSYIKQKFFDWVLLYTIVLPK